MIRTDVVEVEHETRFDVIFDAHHAEIVRYCVRRLGAEDGEDAAAEVFAVVWRRLDELPEGDGRRAWLFGVAHRVVGNQYRSRARRSKLISTLIGTRRVAEDRDDATSIAEAEPILDALASLSRTDQEILRMRAWDGLTSREIAGVLGINENSVDQRIFKARSRLRRRLEAEVGPSDRSDA